jgi:TRAP-type C4-dicarboxylate transport system permease small subunit
MQPTKAPLLRWLMKVNLACGVIAGIALILMMSVGAIDVIGTNLDLFGLPSAPVPAAFEFMTTMMVVSVFLSISLGQARRTHIRVEVIVDRFPRSLRFLTDILRHGLSVIFFAAIAYFGALSAFRGYSVGEFAPGIINFPVWPSRLFLAFGAGLVTVQCVLDLIGVFNTRYRVDEPGDSGGSAAPIS